MKALWQRRKKWIIAGGVLLALALGLFLLPRFINQPAAIEAATVDAAAARAEVTVGDLVSEASAGGEIVAGRAAALALMTGGTIAEIPVEVGDAVRAGDVLLRLETAELERAVGQAEQARCGCFVHQTDREPMGIRRVVHLSLIHI